MNRGRPGAGAGTGGAAGVSTVTPVVGGNVHLAMMGMCYSRWRPSFFFERSSQLVVGRRVNRALAGTRRLCLARSSILPPVLS